MRTRLQTAENPERRIGFTLVELLIVIGIIAILLALTTAAYFRVKSTQEQSATEMLIRKLSSILDEQWKAAIDQIKDEYPPNEVVQWATNPGASADYTRAKVLWLKLRLRQEFPMSFAEATTNLTLPAPYNTYVVPAKQAYRNALAGIPPGYYPWEIESSACLYLALSQARRGRASASLEDVLGTGAIRELNYVGRGVTGAPVDIRFRIIVDLLTRTDESLPAAPPIRPLPIRVPPSLFFIRSPIGNPLANPATNSFNPGLELDSTAPLPPGATRRDPQDPEGLLTQPVPAAPLPATWWGTINRARFENRAPATPILFLPGHWISNPAGTAPESHYVTPLIGSCGRNGSRYVTKGQPSGLAFDNVGRVIVVDADSASDNIYSFRLRQFGARGD